MTLHVEPAYGRDYKSKAEIIASWANGEDFRITSMGPDCGRYVNSSDYPKGELQVRYAAQRKVCVIDATAKPPVAKASIEVALAGDVPEPARKRGELRPGDRVKLKPNLIAAGLHRGTMKVLEVGRSFVACEVDGASRLFGRLNVTRVSS